VTVRSVPPRRSLVDRMFLRRIARSMRAESPRGVRAGTPHRLYV
jgi:hypothetical protein